MSENVASICGETAFINFGDYEEKEEKWRWWCGSTDASKNQGSYKVENKTLFNVSIYVDISQSITACSLGTSLVSSFSNPWSRTSKRVMFCPVCFCLCSRSLCFICSLFLA